MGLANLVPGISGGTMLLAAGVYTRFIEAVSSITRLRFDRRELLFLLVVAAAAASGIILLAGPIKDSVVNQRWVMYSLFVGLTLGGIPALWRLARPATPALWAGASGGFVVMTALALAQQAGAGASGPSSGGFLPLFVAGTAGAASMILPGISGGYLLLVLGQYVPILSAIDRAADATVIGDMTAAREPVLGVFLPVGLGMLVGIAGVANVLRWLLHAHPKGTLGFLLGLLVGVVVGLWPFQQGVPPQPGNVIRGQVMTPQTVAGVAPEDWPVVSFVPSPRQVGGGALLIALGATATVAVTRIGNDD